MSKSTHTPGQIKVGYTSAGQYEVDPPPKTAKERAAYARLFEAAPAMASALKRMLAVYEALMPGLRHIAVKDYREINEAPIAARAALEGLE